MLKILFMVSTLSAFTFNVDSNVQRHLHVLDVTYITPAMQTIEPSNHREHSFLLKLNTLMNEAQNGMHPEYRCQKIIKIAEDYIAMSKSREIALKQMNKEMEVYLGTRKTK